MSRDAHLAAEVEQIVLDMSKLGACLCGQFLGEQQADHGIQFIHLAQRMHALAILGNARAVAKTGLPCVAGAGIYLCQAVAHRSLRWQTGDGLYRKGPRLLSRARPKIQSYHAVSSTSKHTSTGFGERACRGARSALEQGNNVSPAWFARA